METNLKQVITNNFFLLYEEQPGVLRREGGRDGSGRVREDRQKHLVHSHAGHDIEVISF